jgi:RNA polymerase-binding transcription factor DksA
MMEVSKRYSDKDLAEFKDLVMGKIDSANKDLVRLRDSITQGAGNGTNDTYSSFKAFEEGSETLSKESNSLLAQRQEKFIRDLRNALIRIENKTYGICRVTGKLIKKERLKLVPHATLSIEAKQMQNRNK